MAETIEAGNTIYQPGTCEGGRYSGWPCIKVIKRAGHSRSRFAVPAGTLVPVKTLVYRDEAGRDKALKEQQERLDYAAMKRAEVRAERAKPHAFKVGDILVCSWGWEQTNVDFYTVTATTPHTVELAPIASGLTENGTGNSMAGYKMPEVPPRIVSEERTKHRANASGSVKITDYSWAQMWDGREKYTSWYA